MRRPAARQRHAPSFERIRRLSEDGPAQVPIAQSTLVVQESSFRRLNSSVDRPVAPDRGGQGEQALSDAGEHAMRGSGP